MRLSRVFAVFSVSLIAVTAGLSPAQGVEPSPAPTPSASEAVEEPAAPEAAPEPTASPAASPEATPESPDDPLSVGDRLASEIDSIPSRPDVPSVDHNPEARGADDANATLPDAAVAVLEPGESTTDNILSVDTPTTEEILTEIAGLGDLNTGRPDLILKEVEAVHDGAEIVVQTMPLDDGSLPGAAVAFRVRALDRSHDGTWVELTLDASSFANAFGGDYGDRVQLVEFPACALTTPEIPSCVTGNELAEVEYSDGVIATGFLELDTPDFATGGRGLAMYATGEGSIIAAVSGASGATGTFTATDLGTDSQWQVSEQYGSFTYAIPIAMPTPPVGATPDVVLSYNSGVVDGQGLSTNNQPSWVGQGWSLGMPYIERLYKPCHSDGYSARGAELCWDSPYSDAGQAAYVLSFGGSTQELIWDGGNRYRTSSDTGWRITLHKRGASSNGDDDGEYFRLMTPDGGLYYFGYGHIKQDGKSDVATHSVATVPVYGDDAGEPRCGTSQSNYCKQGYRWMLDISQDANENAVTYTYAQETNRYSAGGDPSKSVTYTAAIVPESIEYGSTNETRITGSTAKLTFITKNRCRDAADSTYGEFGTTTMTCQSSTTANAAEYPDTPLDLKCTATCTSAQRSPVFFTTKRLFAIRGYVRDSAKEWTKEMATQFVFAYPSTNDGGARALWLDTVQTRYFGGVTSGQEQLTDYVYDFDGINLKNRVDYTSSVRYMDKRRIATINTPDGLDINVTYATSGGRHCPTSGSGASGWSSWYSTVQGNWDGNTWDCFPQHFASASGSVGFAIFHKYLVDKVVLEDRVVPETPTKTIDYSYGGNPGWGYQNNILFARGAGHQTWNSWRGYSKVRVVTGSGTTKTATVTQYYRGLHDDWQVGGTTRTVNITPMNNDFVGLSGTIPDYYSRQGRVIATKTFDGDGSGDGSGDGVVRARTQTTYTDQTMIDGPSVHNSVWVDAKDVYQSMRLDKSNGSLKHEQLSKTTTTYDTYHRVASVLSRPYVNLIGGEVLDSCTTYEYVDRVGNTDDFYSLSSTAGWGKSWYMWKVSVIRTRHQTCSGTVMGRTSLYYDGNTSLSAQKPADGNVTKEVNYIGGSEYTTTTATYDSRGRIKTATLPDGTSTSAWAYASDGFLTKVTFTNALGQTEIAWLEPVFGNVVKVKRVDGLYEHYVYDAGGRPLEAYAAEQYGQPSAPNANIKPSSSYVYDSSAANLARRSAPSRLSSRSLRDYDGNGDANRSYTLFDGFGREIQTWAPAQDGSPGRSVVTKTYDSQGNLTRVTAPFYNEDQPVRGAARIPFNASATPSYTYTTYDWAGRPTSVQQKSHGGTLSTTTHQYRGDTIVVATPASTTTTLLDGLGRTLMTETGTPTGDYTRASYTYAVNANGTTTTTVRDAANRATIFTTDWLGRTTEMSDPNAGVTTYEYDANGNISTVVSSAGRIESTFDALGRQTTRVARTGELQPAQSTTTWTYDTNGAVSAPGQLVKTVHADGGLHYTTEVVAVDAKNRPITTRVTLPSWTALGAFSGESYESTVTYDDSGRVLTATLPAVAGAAQDTVTTTYTRFGTVKTLASAAAGNILSAVSRTFDGRVTGRTLLAGSTIVDRELVWDEHYRRVTGVVASAGGDVVQGDTYAYDVAGRVASITDEVARLSQCYTYDNVNRLVEVWTQSTDVYSECTPVYAGDYSWQQGDHESAYRQTWSYEPTGEITAATNTTLTTEDEISYTYGSTAHPNAVTAVETYGSATKSYTYDAAGRMTSRPGPGGVTQQLAWDVLSNLTGIVSSSGNGTAYLYDASGQRFAAVTGTSATVYMGAWEATDPNTTDGSDADVTVTRYYSAGGVQLASKSTGGPTLITLGDVQGSAQVTVDATGAVTRNAYTPYGTKRAGSTIASAHGWLNQIADADTGLTYLNARYYDPELGRFLSPDPLMNPGDPRTLDPYRYADNNPVVYTDETGLNPSCGTYSAATQVCWSSYASANATDPATKAAHKTVVQNSKGKISRPSGSECLAGAHCREIDIWNDTMPFTPIPLDKAYRYNVLLRAKMAPEIHVPSTIEILGATASLTAYEFFAGDAERCAGGSASDCGFAALGVIPGLGKVSKLGSVGDDSVDIFRHVSPAEADDIVEWGGFRPGPNSMSGKWFATSAADAATWGRRMDDGVGSVVRVAVPKSALGSAFHRNSLDGVGSAYYFDDLNSFNGLIRQLEVLG